MRRNLILVGVLLPALVVSAFFVIGRTEAQSVNNRTQNVLLSGETIIGEVSSIQPAPEFLIAANPGEVLSIDVIGMEADLEPMFRIMDGSEEIVAEEWLTEGSDRLHVDLFVLRSDRFAVQIQSANNQTGRFSLSVARNEDAFAQVSNLDVGDTITGEVNSENPMSFYTLDYSSTEPLMLIVSSPTYLPPVMIENTETRQLVGQMLPPMHASMMCMAPGMQSHRVNIMYSGDVPEQAYELTLLPVSGDFARYCTSQLAASGGSATLVSSAFAPVVDIFPPIDTDDIGLDDIGVSDIGVSDIGTTDTGVSDIGSDDAGGDDAGGDGCPPGSISLCLNGNASGNGAGALATGNIGDTGINIGNGTGGDDGAVINLDANGGDGNGISVNTDTNAGDQDNGININAGGGDGGGITVDGNAGDQDVDVDSNNLVDDLGGLLGGG